MKLNFWLFLFLIVLVSGCSTTKSLRDGDVLYTGTNGLKLNLEESSVSESDRKFESAGRKLKDIFVELWVSPNGGAGFPIVSSLPIRLYIYNLFYTDKEKGFSHWMMKNFGEPPITIREVNPERRAQIVGNRLNEMGHFGARVDYTLTYNQKRNKASISYSIQIPMSYRYRNIEFSDENLNKGFTQSFNNFSSLTYLDKGEEFNTDSLEIEMARLLTLLQNDGYYFIRKNDIELLADTTVGNRQVDMRFVTRSGLPPSHVRRVQIDSIKIEFENQAALVGDKFFWSYNDRNRIRRKLLDQTISVKAGENFSLNKTKRTINNLSGLGIFDGSSLDYQLWNEDSTAATAVVNLQPADEVMLGINTQAALKNTGYIGPAVGVNAHVLNVFGGAEILTVSLDGYYDFPYGVFRERSTNSYGFSFNSQLSAPMFNSPFKFIRSTYAVPKKFIGFTFEHNNRSDYYKIANWRLSYGFEWQSSPRINHKLEPVHLSYSNLLSTTPQFDSMLENSSQLKYSFEEQVIVGSAYTFRYDNSSTRHKRLGTFFETNVELSGNVLNGLYSIFSDSKQGDRKVLGVRFSQYARLTTDFRAYLRVGHRENQLVFRNIFNIGRAFGNSEYMPYIKQFFNGGTNSMRPVNARNIGPGRYIELSSGAVNQVGDIRMEWNLEYRFHLGPKLVAAIWTDAGNIWLNEDDPERPYSGIRWNKIFPDSYLTTGIGLRLNLKYMTLRVDYGVVLYAPLFIDGYKWIWQNQLPLYGPVIAFGQPF